MQGTNNAETIIDGDTYADDISALGGNDLIVAARELAWEHIDGGDGIDTISYVNLYGVTVELKDGGDTYVPQSQDILSSIENVIGSTAADTLIGNGGVNELFGSGGDDFLEGNGGGDKIDGGSGFDTASYSGSAVGVEIWLDHGKGYRGEAQGDRLFGIEAITGSGHDDLLRGNAVRNVLDGGDGKDVAMGFAGKDALVGGSGNDLLVGGADADRLTGGSGADTFRFVDKGDSFQVFGHRDTVTDFNHSTGDMLDFGLIDARASQAGLQDFHFIGDAGFSAEGQIRAYASHGDVVVEVNTNGATGAEMSVLIDDVVSLGSGDFVL